MAYFQERKRTRFGNSVAVGPNEGQSSSLASHSRNVIAGAAKFKGEVLGFRNVRNGKELRVGRNDSMLLMGAARRAAGSTLGGGEARYGGDGRCMSGGSARRERRGISPEPSPKESQISLIEATGKALR